MFAWISTPDIGPSGVGWMSRPSVNVAPTNTIFPLNGLSRGTVPSSLSRSVLPASDLGSCAGISSRRLASPVRY